VNRPAVNGWNAEYLDTEYQRYLADSASVTPDLRQFFAGFDLALNSSIGVATPSTGAGAATSSITSSAIDYRVSDLVETYRARGHLAAKIDPFGRARPRPAELAPKAHVIGDAEMGTKVRTALGAMTVRELIDHLEAIYCGSVGVEFMHIPDKRERDWFIEKFEGNNGWHKHFAWSAAQKKLILEQLTDSEVFEKFLGKRYQGKKRFSLEGGESLIACLKWLTQRVGELGTDEIILGMAHRGRLNVLKNYLGKDLQQLFTEFEDSWSDSGNQGAGDVKYHRGYSGDQALLDNSRVVHLSMLNNPSHLESVNPVVLGRCRSRQDKANHGQGDNDRRKVISLLIHGDAAVAGQGVVAECLNMSQLEGYSVGGTIHIVTNNLVGFTTDPKDDRSTEYCTDIGKMVNCPTLHVNGDDPEAVVVAAILAAEYRHEFRKDIFVDIVCFRRYGHNEQDEPGYTQPELTALVKAHPGTPETYRQKLIATGIVTSEQALAMIDAVTSVLDAAQTAAKAKPVNPVPPPGKGLWSGYQGKYCFESPKTSVDAGTIARVCEAMGTVPAGFNVHPKLVSLLKARASLPTTRKLNHADAEQIAIGTLVLQGIPVRLSGQDSRRGTFTQRHAVLRDEKTNVRYTPLNNIANQQSSASSPQTEKESGVKSGGQAMFDVWDSPLSEFAVMGFDFGYSRGAPGTLVMWEGQFGDFVNGAQTMIDQFLASSEVKWHRWAGLVLLLPHGYEGQGPEHSSARIERFLQLCADENMEVVYPTTGAQTFHMLRRQMLRDFRKPLIVMTPKKYLRFEASTIDDLSTGHFQHLIDDSLVSQASKKSVTQVIYCSGKIYHELHERRTLTNRNDHAIVRIEQLYPFHRDLAKSIDDSFPRTAKRVWVQEEPRNQGAFLFIADIFREQLGVNLSYIGRGPSSSPSTGSEHAHRDQQDVILSNAVASLPQPKPESHAGKAVPMSVGAKH